MSFLAPFFLLGLVALSVPILIHLQRRHRTETQTFPSLMFLESIRISSMQRRRIRHWLLLLLRCTALLLLVLAFARPWLGTGAADSAGFGLDRAVVVLLDNSLSMGFEDRWQRATAATRDAIEGIGSGDEATIVVFSDSAAVLNEPTADSAVLQLALGSVELSSRTTRFGPAFRMARKLLLESEKPNRRVVLVSDFQRNGWDNDAGELPQGTELEMVDLSGRSRHGPSPSNLVVASLILSRETTDDRERIAVQARVANRGSRALQGITVALDLNGRELAERVLDLDPNATSLVSFDTFSLPDGLSTAALRLAGDQLVEDNTHYFVLSRAQALPVLLVDRPRLDGRGSGFYVERSLALASEPPVRLRSIAERSFSAEALRGMAVVILSDIELPSGDAASALVRFVTEGGGLFLSLGSRSNANRHAALAEAGLLPQLRGTTGRRGSGESSARISYFDRSHPGFEEFSAPRSGDFGAARFFRYHRLELLPEVDVVLARFDDGEPALVERRVGAGRVLVWTSTLDRYWNDFALKPIFVPFVMQSVRRLSHHRPLQASYVVGDIVSVAGILEPEDSESEDSEVGVMRVTDPTGARSEPTEFLDLSVPGLYELTLYDGSSRFLAVNVDTLESDLTALDPAELTASVLSGDETESATSTEAKVLDPAQSERLQGVWRYLVLGLLLVLVAETFLSNRVGARAMVGGGQA